MWMDAGWKGVWLLGAAPACQALKAKPAKFWKGTDPPSRLLESLLLYAREMAGTVSSTYKIENLNVSNNESGNACGLTGFLGLCWDPSSHPALPASPLEGCPGPGEAVMCLPIGRTLGSLFSHDSLGSRGDCVGFERALLVCVCIHLCVSVSGSSSFSTGTQRVLEYFTWDVPTSLCCMGIARRYSWEEKLTPRPISMARGCISEWFRFFLRRHFNQFLGPPKQLSVPYPTSRLEPLPPELLGASPSHLFKEVSLSSKGRCLRRVTPNIVFGQQSNKVLYFLNLKKPQKKSSYLK